jgi:hypothetical protein
MSSIRACVVPSRAAPVNDVERQIAAAFDYRGQVTLALKRGERVVGGEGLG